MTALSDIRVGDIMLCPDGIEREVVESHVGRYYVVTGGVVWMAEMLRNPEFRVGDKVRLRGPTRLGITYIWPKPDELAVSDTNNYALLERAPVSDKVKQDKAGFIIEAWKQWPEHRDDGSCTAAGCGVCAIDKAEDTVPDNKVETCLCCPNPPRPGEPTCANCYEPVRKTQEMFKGKFVKHDESKPRMDLLPPLALKAMARVLTLGSYKYSDHNWRNIPREERSRLVASLLRHVTAAMAGEDNDAESGASHWAHAMANAAFLCELFELDKIAEDKFRR